MRALLQHVWLLLTLRHNGDGLPRSWPPLFALIAVASFAAAVRWEVLYEPYLFSRAIELSAIALALFFWLLLLALISPRFAAAYALISMGADFVTILIAPVRLHNETVALAILALELAALIRIAAKLYVDSSRAGRR